MYIRSIGIFIRRDKASVMSPQEFDWSYGKSDIRCFFFSEKKGNVIRADIFYSTDDFSDRNENALQRAHLDRSRPPDEFPKWVTTLIGRIYIYYIYDRQTRNGIYNLARHSLYTIPFTCSSVQLVRDTCPKESSSLWFNKYASRSCSGFFFFFFYS